MVYHTIQDLNHGEKGFENDVGRGKYPANQHFLLLT